MTKREPRCRGDILVKMAKEAGARCSSLCSFPWCLCSEDIQEPLRRKLHEWVLTHGEKEKR